MTQQQRVMVVSLYDSDFPLWADKMAQLLREHRWEELDLEHLVEEVEDLGNRHRDAIKSHLTRLLMHLLKWQFQPQRRSSSWQSSIREARKQIQRLHRDYPSLKSFSQAVFSLCYLDAREDAADETGLAIATFPAQPPFSLEQALEGRFFPANDPD